LNQDFARLYSLDNLWTVCWHCHGNRFGRCWCAIRRILRSKELSSIEEEKSGTFKEALAWTIVWISLAAIFAEIIYVTSGYGSFLEFVTGYTLEKIPQRRQHVRVYHHFLFSGAPSLLQ
jgi:hypothetical protein